MKTNPSSEQRQYARVARIIPKTAINNATTKIKALVTNKGRI